MLCGLINNVEVYYDKYTVKKLLALNILMKGD